MFRRVRSTFRILWGRFPEDPYTCIHETLLISGIHDGVTYWNCEGCGVQVMGRCVRIQPPATPSIELPGNDRPCREFRRHHGDF